MSRSWNLTGFDFFTLWLDTTGDPLPAPFWHSHGLETMDQYVAAQHESRERLGYMRDDDFSEMVEALTNPDISVTIGGMNGADFTRTEGLVRLGAFRRGERGFVVHQESRKTFWQATGITITTCDAIALAPAAVGLMPEEKPGRGPGIVLPRREERVLPGERRNEDLDYSFGESAWNDSFEETDKARGERFLQTVPLCSGVIEIAQGHSIFGPRGITRHRLEWRDLEDDGRYVIDDQQPPVATSVDNAKLIAMINTRIASVVRAIKEERT